MSIAALIAACTAIFSGTLSALHFAMSRAPRWRGARVFGVIALTSSLYALVDLVFCTPGLRPEVYVWGGRVNYLVASVHGVAWLVYTFGGPDASWSVIRRPLRWLASGFMGVALFFAVTGLHLALPLVVITVPWASTTYHYPTSTALGQAYAVSIVAVLAVSFVEIARRAWRGEPGMRVQLGGFVFFLACSVTEALVANRVEGFLSLGDLGFLAIVLTTTYQVARRFLADARALDVLSARLQGEVVVRTEERDEVQRRLVEVEPLAALGRLAAGVGHEINNPLVYVRSGLDRISEFVTEVGAPADVRAALDDAAIGLLRIQGAVEALRVYSDAPLTPASCQVSVLVDLALDDVRSVIEARAVQLVLDVDRSLRVTVDAQRIVDAVCRVLDNAVRAASGAPDAPGRVRVSVRAHGAAEISIDVEDDGPGIAPADLARLGEPYFTTRAHEGALGLGLFAARAVLGAHGGRLVCESAVGRGTTIRLVLPAEERSPSALDARVSVARASESVPMRGATRPRVLVVDDDPLVLRSLERMLGRRWDVTAVESAERALDVLRGGASFDAIVSDLTMPGMSGIELADRLAAEWPELRRRTVFVTGGAASPAAAAFLARDDVRYLTKPVATSTLLDAVDSLVGSAQSV